MIAADGAGSACRAEVGSHLVCDCVVELVSGWIAEGKSVSEITRETVSYWFESRLVPVFAQLAESQDLTPRDFATTLLTAIVATDAAVFFQVGDGAIVVENSEGQYKPIFWPQIGEYANTTYFVTDTNVLEHIAFDVVNAKIDEAALFTDGLQMLALQYDTRSVHAPFFLPMFRRLRHEPPGEAILGPLLEDFLGSPAVCGRTDDDKTLLLATPQAESRRQDDPDSPGV
jgi:hypothetical protein